MKNPRKLDPAKMSKFSHIELAELCDMNEVAAAKNSLDATLHHWMDGRMISCRDWISELLEDVRPVAIDLDILEVLTAIQEVLDNGNQSMKWLKSFKAGTSVPMLLSDSIKAMKIEEDVALNKEGC
jgi:predicted glutamate--cysteine ligase